MMIYGRGLYLATILKQFFVLFESNIASDWPNHTPHSLANQRPDRVAQ